MKKLKNLLFEHIENKNRLKIKIQEHILSIFIMNTLIQHGLQQKIEQKRSIIRVFFGLICYGKSSQIFS